MTTLEVLKAAREHLSDPARWYKGDLQDPRWDGPDDQVPCCAMGAVRRAVLAGGDSLLLRGEVRALHDAMPEGFDALDSFNDDPSTTHADILALFDRAIAAEEARQ